jgi:hypothetical protein
MKTLDLLVGLAGTLHLFTTGQLTNSQINGLAVPTRHGKGLNEIT